MTDLLQHIGDGSEPSRNRVPVDREFLAALFGEEALGRMPSGVVPFSFSNRVRRAFRAPKSMKVSEWAERHMIVVEGSRPGPWRNENAPYLAGVLDAWGNPNVREVVFCAAPQVGKSKVGEVAIGYVADQDPSPVMYVVPDEESALDVSRDRLLPLFQQSPDLVQYLSSSADDRSLRRMKLNHMPLHLAWARSAARLASKAVKHVIFDEVDKYPAASSKKEADPMSLADKRQRTYRWDKKTLKFSSPTVEEGPIWKALHECNAVFYYHARCPVCGYLQRLEFTAEDGAPRVGWPEDVRDPGRIESEHLAWYECVQCKAHWDDYQRDKAVKLGQWRESRTGTELFAYLDANRPARVGFHLSALYSQFVSLSETAATFLRKKSDKIKLRDFLNGYLAEPWKDYSIERREDHIFALCDERPRGHVPGGDVVSCLTAGVDTQDDGFWFEVRAWGWGMEMPSWQIREGFAHSFDGLEEILFGSRYADSDDKEYPVNFVVIDAMGHRTREVYDWCRRWPGRVLPFKGEARMTQNLAVSIIDTYPGTRKPIPGGVRLLRGHVTFFKDALDGKLQIAPADPGAWLMHSECSEAWARQMCAEYRDERGLWQCPKGKANHAWDCSVYNLVAADFIQVKYRRKQEEPKQEPAKQPSAQRGKPNWFNSGGHVPYKRW